MLAAFGALVLDRDARRRRWAAGAGRRARPDPPGRAGRPPSGWRGLAVVAAAAGVLLGCACAVKWSGLYFVPAFALLVILWEVGVRRSAGVRRPWRDTLLDELPWLLLAGVLMVGHLPGHLVRLAAHRRRLLPAGQPLPERARLSDAPVIGALINLWEYHKAAYGFHTELDDRAQVPVLAVAVAAARPAGRLLLVRRGRLRRAELRLGDPAAGHPAALVVVPAGAGGDWPGSGVGPAGLAGRGDPALRGRRPAALVLVRPGRPDDVLLLRRAGAAVPGAGGGLRARRDHLAGRRARRSTGRRRPGRRRSPTVGWSAGSSPARTCCWWRSASPTSTRSSSAGCCRTRTGRPGCGWTAAGSDGGGPRAGGRRAGHEGGRRAAGH